MSQKVEEIQKNSASSLCWYYHRHGIQLQFYGHTHIANADIVKEYQDKLHNLRDYTGPKPGIELGSIINEEVHFTVLIMKVEEIIALKLGGESHEKYHFTFSPNGIESKKVVP